MSPYSVALVLALLLASCESPRSSDTATAPTRPAEHDATPTTGMPRPTDEQPSEVERLRAELESTDPNTRARAARRLWELGHADALAANLRTLDDAPDSLHPDYTPAVGALIDIGEPALQPLLEYLDAADELTRRRATNAVLGITRKLFGFDPQRGWPGGAEARWHTWWAQIGYDPSLDAAARRQAIDRLATWLEQPRDR